MALQVPGVRCWVMPSGYADERSPSKDDYHAEKEGIHGLG
jgi:hypothetical protein